jgi:hypothetical protein
MASTVRMYRTVVGTNYYSSSSVRTTTLIIIGQGLPSGRGAELLRTSYSTGCETYLSRVYLKLQATGIQP